jgi:hypothetical protein
MFVSNRGAHAWPAQVAEKRAPRAPQPRKAAPPAEAAGAGDERRARRPRVRKPRDDQEPSGPVNTSSDRLECHDFKETGSCNYGARRFACVCVFDERA